jgi:2-polyprenyl-3-methyl-5-hydroxy-6-metoxy-1,4-benzoquinol methylase
MGAINSTTPYLSGVFQRQYDTFGEPWAEKFNTEMGMFFQGDADKIMSAARGYGAFCLDSMKLQVKFNKTKQYDNKTYEEAASEVYQNQEYMDGLYLPGILISHYLWEHHYKQHLFFESVLCPKIASLVDPVVYDVGVGTGFYSKEFLRVLPDAEGEGFDMSPHSLRYTQNMLAKWGYESRYKINLGDILARESTDQCDIINSIEVLEHLEDPAAFLVALYGMLKPGGIGFISAAINAPNADHIYLYRSASEVQKQIETAGFKVDEFIEDGAYLPRTADDLVPVNAAFIVSK